MTLCSRHARFIHTVAIGDDTIVSSLSPSSFAVSRIGATLCVGSVVAGTVRREDRKSRVHLFNKSDKQRNDKSPLEAEAIREHDVPSVRIVLSENADVTTAALCDRNARSSKRQCSSFWYKFIFALAFCFGLLYFIIKLYMARHFLYIYSNITNHVNQQTYGWNRVGQDLPVERTSSSEVRTGKTINAGMLFGYRDIDRTEPVSNLDIFPSNRQPIWTRLKREIARDGKGCGLNDQHCMQLLQSMESYLEKISKVLPNQLTDNDESVFKDILMCLKCKNGQQSTTAIEAGKGSARPPSDHYQTHNYVVVQNRIDSLEPDIELLDDDKAKDGSQYQNAYSAGGNRVNRTEVTRIQASSTTSDVSQDAVPSSPSTNTADTTVVSIDRTSSNGTARDANGIDLNDGPTTTVNDVRSSSEPVASDSRIVKVPSDGRIPASLANVDEGRAIAQGNVAKSSVATLPSPTTEMSTETSRYNTNIMSINDTMSKTIATTVYPVSPSETNTPSTIGSVDFTRQITVAEDTTSEPTWRIDVIGIVDDDDGAGRATARPSDEGHPENQSSAAAKEGRLMPVYWPFVYNVNQLHTNTNGKPAEDLEQTSENAQGFQEIQLSPTMSWTMPHPVCFHGPPGQPANRQSAPGTTFYPGLSGPQRESPTRGSSSQPNYMQVQVTPRLNYAGNPAQAQTGPGVGPTGPGVPNFSLRQQPAGTSSSVPYFCTYISMPIVRFPPIPGVTQRGQSAPTEMKQSAQAVTKPGWRADWLYKSASTDACPPNSRLCASDGYCVPKVKWCDGRVDCTIDASDETMCSCRDRISRDRLCDGYFDCPHGEDELGCFDCPQDSFSCDDWEQRRSSENCVPLEQRCDGIKHCRNGKDELDCNILSPSYIDRKDVFTIGYTQGYLHKNVRGQWYPVCAGEPSWSIDACLSETGQPLTAMPEIRIVRLARDESFQGPYVNGSDGKTQFVSSCSDTAVFVKCPPFLCGTMYPRQDSSPVFNVKDIGYAYKKRAEEKEVEEEEEEEEERLVDSEPAKFAELYWRTLGLLDENRSKSDERNDNDTLVGLQSRVVGGRTSRPMAWPYLVAIYKDGDFHCGGVILNEIRVLTAAHCMDGYEMHYFEVRAGMLRQLSFSPTAQSRRVKNVALHENYDSYKMQNDIALVTLDEPLLFNRWVRQVCLPAADVADGQWRQSPSSRSKCIAIGWGAMRENGPDPDHLREVEVPILPSCKYPYDRNDTVICAGYPQGGRDACQGDSGGPLMCREDSYTDAQWYAAGVISHGDGCGRPNEPGVYTKVSHFVQWIRETSENSVASSDKAAPLASCPGFSCRTGLGKCLPMYKICDRIVDCLDAEDEVDCFWKPGYRQYWQSDGNNEFVKSTHHEISLDSVSDDTADNQTNETVFVPFVPYKTQESADKDDRSNATNASSVRLTFTCTRLIQTITINKRCDRRVDCQDGTDEDDCTCRDFLANLQPAAICDGHPDCDDRTDEKSCGMCKEDEFLCGRSGTCILIERLCDGKFDCPLREDEIDCFALTDGDHVSVDSDNRPLLNAEGLLSKYANGTWRTECISGLHDEVIAEVGENTCQYLGFAGSRSVDKVVVNKTELTTGSREDWRDAAAGACTALRIRCGPVLSGSADSHLVVDPRTGSRTYLWPWLAAIFVDGRYRCSALLLEPDWLLSNARCTRDIRLSVNYTTALLGRSRSYLYVDGPYQQISIVDQIKNVKQSNASLLHLKTAVNLTHQVLPLFAGRKIYPPKKSDLCVAIGTDEAHVTRSIFVQPILDNCDKCRRCFIETADTSCSISGLTSSWSGTVFCHSRKGWYPAAVFQENDGPCSFRNVRNLTSIDYVQAYLTQALEDKVRPIVKPACDGVRCGVGQCVPWNRVCDGVLDCRDGADERIDRCNGTQGFNNIDRKCTKSELRCGNGECVPKRMFCDDKVDCSDGTDEPVICTCAEYLKVTAPERLCDGVRHCVDKSDESPEVCHCTENSFKCDTKNENSTCLPQDFVCDGDKDCPNGEDEKLCVKVKEFKADRPGEGEVIQRSYGVWHSRCFPAPVTSQEEARTTCAKLGYANGTIDEGAHPTADEPTVPFRDDFYMVRVNVDTWIIMRDAKPLVSLVRPEEPCHRLFVKCTS